ncbi:MAG: Holliday junction branch migration protein RuvA [Methanoregula sp.]|nr:Holliday junction branch migration protein RuvA [Methanoregula sp.]
MIAHLYGEPIQTGDRWVVLDVNGIGYRVYVPVPEVQEIAGSSGKVRLFTHMAVREDGITLYGFLHGSEREIFSILIGVSGIGPQTALNILSQITIADFALAILTEDEKTLTRISGIGSKSAKRLILELKDKMKKVRDSMPPVGAGRGDHTINDAASALISLGFAEKASYDAVKVSAAGLKEPTVQTLIKAALVKLKEH